MNHIISPDNSDRGIEQLIQAEGLDAHRRSLADLDANIVDTEIVKHVSRGGQVLRWAILTTKSGFAVTGNPSVAVSAENDDAEVGIRVATENSRNALWPLTGYALKEQLSKEAA